MKPKLSVSITGVLLAIGIGFVLIAGCADQAQEESKAEAAGTVSEAANLPMLVDLGKGTCIPCKKMKPILDELTKEYEGRAIVKVIDLRYEPRAARQYGVRLIPTQIFYDAEGNEVYRHQGFMDKKSIEMKFAEMGVY